MSLSISSDEFADFISEETQEYVVELSTQVFRDVVDYTPVMTGQLRASWSMTKYNPDFSTIDEGSGLPPPTVPNLQFAKGEYPLIFIANGKRYAEYVEFGTDKMGPRGMVARALANVR